MTRWLTVVLCCCICSSVGAQTALDDLEKQIDSEQAANAIFGAGFGEVNVTVEGALVRSLHESSPADRAGVKLFDRVSAINGRTIRSDKDLAAAMATLKPNESVVLGVIRGVEPLTITIEPKKPTLRLPPPVAAPPRDEPRAEPIPLDPPVEEPAGEEPPPEPTPERIPFAEPAPSVPAEPRSAVGPSAASADRPVLGVYPRNIAASDRNRYGVTVFRGAVIDRVQPDSIAEAVGFRQGDTIVALDGARVDSPEDLYAVLRGVRRGQELRVLFNRGGRTYAQTITMVEPSTEPRRVERPITPAPSEPGDRPALRALEGILDRVLPREAASPPPPVPSSPPVVPSTVPSSPPADPRPAVDGDPEIQALRRHVDSLQTTIETLEQRIRELEKR